MITIRMEPQDHHLSQSSVSTGNAVAAEDQLPVLYSFRRCPYAMRARLAIKAAAVPVALREVSLREKPAAMLAASPKGTVPVLHLPSGVVLEQSIDIMRWALNIDDPQGWLSRTEDDEVRLLIAVNDGPFKQALDRYKYAPAGSSMAGRPARDEAVAIMLAPLNARLTRHRFLLRDSCSIADMAIVPFVRQFAAVDEKWFEQMGLEPLNSWLKKILAMALFESIMAKHSPWQPGDAANVF